MKWEIEDYKSDNKNKKITLTILKHSALTLQNKQLQRKHCNNEEEREADDFLFLSYNLSSWKWKENESPTILINC